MNRVYNNEAIIMACIVHLLKTKKMDIALLYLLSTLLIDGQLSKIIQKSMDFDILSNSIKDLGVGLLSRKLISLGPYFINAVVILKQSNTITISDSDGMLHLVDQTFPEGKLGSKRLGRILRNADILLEMCKGLSTRDTYNKLNIQL